MSRPLVALRAPPRGAGSYRSPLTMASGPEHDLPPHGVPYNRSRSAREAGPHAFADADVCNGQRKARRGHQGLQRYARVRLAANDIIALDARAPPVAPVLAHAPVLVLTPVFAAFGNSMPKGYPRTVNVCVG